MEGWIVVVDNAKDLFGFYFGGEFFADFSDDALLGSFAWFKLAAGDFPPAFPVTVTAGCGKDFFFVCVWICAEDDGSADGDFGHGDIIEGRGELG